MSKEKAIKLINDVENYLDATNGQTASDDTNVLISIGLLEKALKELEEE